MLADEPVRALPDAAAIARRLSERPGLAVLLSTDPGRSRGERSFVACEPDLETSAWDPREASGEPTTASTVPRFIGVLPYEARRELERPAWAPRESRPAPPVTDVAWRRYPGVLVVDHARGSVRAVGASAARCRDLARWAEAPEPARREVELDVLDAEPCEAHEARVARAIELIYAGDLYQVNLARALDVHVRADGGPTSRMADLVTVLEILAGRARTPFGALLEVQGASIVSTSPELFLDVRPRADGRLEVVTEPIKGTRPRSSDPAVDAARVRELDLDPKERAELAMIVDVERNDLSRVCEAASVKVAGAPRVETYATVHHRVATVVGTTRQGVGLRDVLSATWPSGSVTGAPKIRAMEVIASLEPVRRGLYTGALGYVAYDGSMRLAMAIRTLVVDASGAGTYLTGGGITARSVPATELEETRWKAAQLWPTPSG